MNRVLLLAALLTGASLSAPGFGAPAAAMPATATVFDTLDTDHDQQLSRQEFQAGYASLQRTLEVERRLREQFRTLDTDRSGALEAAEYARLVLVRQAGAKAPPHTRFDADRSGGLGFGEYLAAIRALAPVAAPAATP
jgi:hypothetical protein